MLVINKTKKPGIKAFVKTSVKDMMPSIKVVTNSQLALPQVIFVIPFFFLLLIIPVKADERFRPLQHLYFDFDFATKIFDEWSRAQLFDYLGKICDIDELKNNAILGPSSNAELTGQATPGSYGEWVNLNWGKKDLGYGWQKYSYVKNRFDRNSVPRKHRAIRSLRQQIRDRYSFTTVQYVLDFKPEAMDLEYFKQCYDAHRIYYYWVDLADGASYIDKDFGNGTFPNWFTDEQWAEANEAWANKRRGISPKRLFRPR